MKRIFHGLAFAAALCSQGLYSAQVEADFNDLYLGDTRTRGMNTSKNDGNLNTGTGFTLANGTASGGSGEYNNNTGVVQFERGDLEVPEGVEGFQSVQSTPVDPAAAGSGVVFGSGIETSNPGNRYRRFQERSLATPLTGPEIWFSFLFHLEGPAADARVLFNKPSTEDSSNDSPSAFAIALGHVDHPGRIAIDVSGNAGQFPPAVTTDGAYFQGVEVTEPSAITAHVAIGRIIVNPAGDETIELWIDPPTTENLETTVPTISVTDEIGTGITSIGFEGTRHPLPAPEGGPYNSYGHAKIDHFRMSDNADAFLFVTGNIVVDPKLIISSPTTNFNFRGVYGTGSPVVSQPITVTLKNDGENNPITIQSIDFQTATTIFSSVTNPPIGDGLTLAPGEEIDITVQASGTAFETATANSIVVKTDVESQDLSIGVGATFYTNGSRMHPNPSFETNLDGWINDAYGSDNTPPVRVAPGFLGTGNMVRLRGIADPQGGAPDNLSQTLLNGAADWEFTFTFSPIDVVDFATYAGSDPTELDRTFQVIIQSDGDVPTPAAATGGSFTDSKNADAAMINLAYLPANGQGFSVFNGNNWVSLGLPMISGSTDANKNGRLNPAESDTINYYSVRIKGTGFGTSQARYSVSVTQPNSPVTGGIAENIAIWSSTSGQSNTPGAFTFTTGDVSNSGIIGASNARTTSFWIDEVSFYAGAVRDPAITFGFNNLVQSHNGVTSINSVPVTNTGFTENLVLSAFSFQKPGIFSVTEETITVPPGTTVQIPVAVDPGGFTGSQNTTQSNLTMATNVPRQPSPTISITGAGTTASNLLPNWDFEVSGTDAFTDWDTFAFWDEFTEANLTKDMAGLVDGSVKGVHVASGSALRNTLGEPAGDFIVDTWFAVRETALRAFNINLHGASGGLINVRYEGATWSAYDGAAWVSIIDMTESPLATSVDQNNDLDLNDPGDTKNVYKLRILGNGWNTDNPVYQIEILDVAGNPVATSAPGLFYFQGGKPSGGASVFTLAASAAGAAANAGFWADDVAVSSVTAESGIVVTSFTGGPGNFTIQWDSGASKVIVERSYTLEIDSWEEISAAGGDDDGTFTDSVIPPAGKAFYRLRTP